MACHRFCVFQIFDSVLWSWPAKVEQSAMTIRHPHGMQVGVDMGPSLYIDVPA